LSGIQVDITGALKKNQMMLNIPKATRYQLTKFGSDAVKGLKRSAQNMKKCDKYHRKTGALARSVGMKVRTSGDIYQIIVGTGVGTSAMANMMAEKYASIQDHGGYTYPKVTPKMRKWAWYMFRQYGEEKFKWIALTKQKHLMVHIPQSGWFTNVWNDRKSRLDSFLNDRAILAVAQRMVERETMPNFGGGIYE